MVWALFVWAQLAQHPYQNYWKYVPEEMQPKMHFYNFAITSNHSSPSYPMNIIRNIFKPGAHPTPIYLDLMMSSSDRSIL